MSAKRPGTKSLRRSAVVTARKAVDPDYRMLINDRQNARKRGLTIEQYRELIGRPCAICGRTAEQEGQERRIMVIDHDHATGDNREPLCTRCNTALGKFGDNIDTVRSALAYLERHAMLKAPV